MKSIITLILLTTALTSRPAHAQVYLGIDLVASASSELDTTRQQRHAIDRIATTGAIATPSASVDDTKSGLGIYTGYKIGWLAVEVGFVDLGTPSLRSRANGTESSLPYGLIGSSDLDQQALSLSAIAHIPVTAHNSLIAKIGAARWSVVRDTRDTSTVTVAPNVTVNTVTRERRSANGTDGVAGIGWEWSISGFGVRALFDQYFDVGDSAVFGPNDVQRVAVSANISF
jgi:hypothetical protein